MAESFGVKRQQERDFNSRDKEQASKNLEGQARINQTSPDYTGKPNPTSGVSSASSFGSRTSSGGGSSRSNADGGVQHDRIAQRAYELWEQRGRQNGHEMEDWLRAERELKNR